MSDVSAQIEAFVPGAVLDEHEALGELTIEVRPDRVLEACRALKDGPTQFSRLSGVTCADYPDQPGRFRLAYHLHSVQTGGRVRLRTWAGALHPEVESVTSVWPGADWQEREVYDQFGVVFKGHPDLCRILNPLDWDGHPLRRDYPIGGEDVEFTSAV